MRVAADGLSFSVGDLTVHRIVELVAPFRKAVTLIPELTPELLDENRGWMGSSLDANDFFVITFQSHIVRTPHHTILVDGCIGNDKQRHVPDWHMKSDGTWMRALAAAGLSVEDIDYVMCTHMHGDHVGWNTRLVNGEWVPTFPNARYVFTSKELECAQADEGVQKAGYQDSVLPILRANRAEIVDHDFQLGDHMRILPTPGHTAGHVALCFGRKSDEAVMTGDLIHVPLQARYPELSFSNDYDPKLSGATRRAFLERYCNTQTVCCTAHFPAPSFGRIKQWGEGYRLDRLENF